jgi:peptidoglycan/LPS O-acetylase OafA/YrhL
VSYGPFNPVVKGGDIGVWVFFALSGYLLYRPFLTRDVDLRSYALKRAARILPGYYVALVGLALVTGSRLAFEHPVPYLTISASYNLELRAFLGPAWTLAAEVIFYMTLPLIARAARGREAPVLLGLGGASIALSLVQRYTATEATVWLNDFYPMVFYAFVPGMLLAALEVKQPAAFAELGRAPLLIAGLALILAGTLSTALPIDIGPLVGAPLVIGWLLHHRVMGARALVFIGGSSYALYLWHYDLFQFFGAAGILVALLGSVASWLLVERPILYWAHRRARLWRAPEPALTPAEAAS